MESKIQPNELGAMNVLRARDIVGQIIDTTITAVDSRQFKQPNGDMQEKRTLTVTIDGKEKSFVIGGDNLGVLVEAYGMDTAKWVGKAIRLTTTKKLNPQTKERVDGILVAIPR